MSFVVAFAGTSPLSPAHPDLAVWSYRVSPVAPDSLVTGQYVALALSTDVPVQGPAQWPDLPELGGMFVQPDPNAAQQFVGRVVTTAGTQTLLFVADAESPPFEARLVTAQPGENWVAYSFSVIPNGALALSHMLLGPATGAAPVSGGALGGGPQGLVIDPSIPPTAPGTPPVTATPPATSAGTGTPQGGTGTDGTPSTHPTPPPASGPPAGPVNRNGRPVADFAGVLPYASEMFGVYQPLAGWFGKQTAQRVTPTDQPRLAAAAFNGPDARDLTFARQNPALRELLLPPAATGASRAAADATVSGVLSPVGLVNLFRQYFFEFDTFLGTPSGHIWISPGGVVEVIEVSTRRTIVEKTTEQSETSTRKTEEDLTQQDDIADAVKEDNANDTKFGISAAGGAAGNLGVATYHAEASTTFSTDTSVKSSSEQTHKHSRIQSNKVSSEITRNFKTTFKTTTDTTDTTSRRYVVQNTTDKLVNYELRRKVRKVGVQLQHIGTRLSWQIFLDNPGRDLGLGELVQTVAAPDLSSLKKPEQPPPLEPKVVDFSGAFPIRKYPGMENDIPTNEDFGLRDPNSNDIRSLNNKDHMIADFLYSASAPAAGYTLGAVRLTGATSGGNPSKFVAHDPIQINDPVQGKFTVMADFLNSADAHLVMLNFSLTWNPPADDPAQDAYRRALADYQVQVAQLQRVAYAEAIRTRLNTVSNIASRPAEDLRSEERHQVYGQLISKLALSDDPHMDSEFIRQIFDVDDMLYFAAPDYWRPGTTFTPPDAGRVGHYPVPAAPDPTVAPDPNRPLAGETVLSWYSLTDKDNALSPTHQASDEWRVNYLITENSLPAPMGSSLGWLVQIDGDERRNEFLNAAWVKIVLPVRPGHEPDALAWLSQTAEGEAGLGLPYPMQPGDPQDYQGKTVGEVLDLLAAKLKAANTDLGNLLASEKVFETGFDPLEGGFRPAEPYQIFDQWIEILPTDQIAAVEVHYDPKTGQQI